MCAPGNLAAERLALLDREERRMLDGDRGNAEVGEKGDQIVAGGGHSVLHEPVADD